MSSSDDEVKEFAPTTDMEFCCLQCGVNHEARDFMCAILLYLIDQLEESDSYIEFLNGNKLITPDSYNDLLSKIEEKQRKEKFDQELEEAFQKVHKASQDHKYNDDSDIRALITAWVQSSSHKSVDKALLRFVFEPKL